MRMTIDDSIRLLEDYQKWEKQLFSFNDNKIDDATSKLLEVAKKYQKIEQIVKQYKKFGNIDFSMQIISGVVEDEVGSEDKE